MFAKYGIMDGKLRITVIFPSDCFEENKIKF